MARVPRIGLVTVSLRPGNGGIARVARLMARSLPDIPVDHEILILDDPDTSAVCAGINSSTASGNRSKFVWQLHLLARRCSHLVYDYAGLGRAHPFLPGLRRPYMVWMHGREAWEGLRPGAKRTFFGAHRTLVNSSHTLARFEHLHGALRSAHVCPLATETSPGGLARADNATPTALIIGRISAEGDGKGHAELIECWPKVIQKVPGARLIIVGDGDALDALKARARESAAADLIVFRGFVPDHEIDALWNDTDILAMPSRQEGFGIVYAEAMARAKPVIASTLDAGNQTNVHSVSGLNVDPRSIDDLTRAVITLLQDKSLCQQMGSAGRAIWEKKYRFEAFEKRFGQELEDFLGADHQIHPRQKAA